MDDRLVLPRELRNRPFTRQEALLLGVPPSAFGSRHLRRIFHGVYVPRRMTVTDSTRCRAALLSARGEVAIGGLTALHIAGVEIPLGMNAMDPVQLARPHVLSHRGAQGIYVHNPRVDYQASPSPLLGGGLLVEPVCALLQVAEMGASPYELITLADGLLRRGHALASVARLDQQIAQAAYLDGITCLRESMALVRSGTDSSMETLMRLAIVSAGFPEPEVNVRVRVAASGATYYVDTGFPSWLVGAEYDGDEFHRGAHLWRKERDRQRELEEQDWLLVRANSSIIHDPVSFLRALATALQRRGWDGVLREPPMTAQQLALPGAALIDAWREAQRPRAFPASGAA